MPNSITDEQSVSLKLFVVLSKAYKTVMDRAVKDIKQHRLAPSEFMILEVLYHKGKVPLQQIGDKILVTSGSMTYNIDKLENKGLLKRVPCETDRRVIFAEITAEGNKLFDQIFPEHAAALDSAMNALSPEEKQTAIELLKKLGKGAETG